MHALSTSVRFAGIGVAALSIPAALVASQELVGDDGSTRSLAQGGRLAVGDPAPALGVADTHGEPVEWGAEGARPALLQFHSERARYSRRGLAAILELPEDDPSLAEEIDLVLVLDRRAGAEALERDLAARFPHVRLVLDLQHEVIRAFGVRAFPSAFCVGTDGRLVGVERGYGTLFAHRLRADLELATGRLDEATYLERVNGARPAISAEVRHALAPALGMARAHVLAGRYEAARRVLTEALEEGPGTPEATALLARLLLLGGEDPAAAATWIERYAQAAPDAIELDLLRARLALARGEYEDAEQRLVGLDPADPRVRLLRADLLTVRGSCEEAAELLRGTLTRMILAEEALPPGSR